MFLRKTQRRIAALTMMVTALLLMQGGIMARAQDKAPTDPTEFLKWSMTHYTALTSFQAECDWSDSFGGQQAMTAKRTLIIAKPNRYKVVSQQLGIRMTSVCDGKAAIEYSDNAAMGAMKNPVPTTIGDVKSMMMMHPMFCGTMLWHFFSGPTKLAELVDTTKQKIAFGPDVTIAGHVYKTVTFFAAGQFGKSEVAIDTDTGLVHRIRYGSEPLMALVASSPAGKQLGKMGTTSDSAEEYTNIVLNSAVPEATFDTTLPKGLKLMDLSAQGGQEGAPKPPVPLGKSAPPFTVKTLAGEKRSLADFRGKVVLIDFWATWCPPCRKGLPETQALAKKYGDKGLAVLAISDEAAKTVAPFIRENHYTFPAYLDAGRKVSMAYNIAAIPTVIIIDRAGRLVTYLVGLQDPATIKAELKKAGLKLN